jgi:hypothetical protein
MLLSFGLMSSFDLDTLAIVIYRKKSPTVWVSSGPFDELKLKLMDEHLFPANSVFILTEYHKVEVLK